MERVHAAGVDVIMIILIIIMLLLIMIQSYEGLTRLAETRLAKKKLKLPFKKLNVNMFEYIED